MENRRLVLALLLILIIIGLVSAAVYTSMNLQGSIGVEELKLISLEKSRK